MSPAPPAEALERVPDIVSDLAARLVSGCDRALVRSVLATVAAGSTGRARRDGRRPSVLTASGAPFEASVTAGAGRSSAALRYVGEPGSDLPFFGPRLAAQRRAVTTLAARLPPGSPAGDEASEVLDVLFPDPAAVPARTRFAAFVGVVHTPRHPDHLTALKVYGNLRAGDPAAGLAGLRRRWAGFGPLDDLTADLTGPTGPLSAQFAAVEVGEASARPKLYLRTRSAGPAGVRELAGRVGAEPAALDDALAGAGLPAPAWRRPVFVCVAAAPPAIELSVHVSARAVGLDTAAMADLAQGLAARHGDPMPVAALLEAAAVAGGPAGFGVSVLGLGLAPGGGIGKVNVYAAPGAGSARGGPAYSNSGWSGARVGS